MGLDVWQYNADGKIIQRWHIHEPQVGNYIASLQPLKGKAMAVGCYGKGVFIITLPGESKNAWRRPPLPTGAAAETNRNNHSDNTGTGTPAYAPEPRGARPPSVAQMERLRDALLLIARWKPRGSVVVPVCDDWRTEGNWIDHYGKMWALLYSMTGLDEMGGYEDPCFVRSYTWVNAHWRKGEAARHWLVAGWRNSSSRHALQDLLDGGRTQASVDDHGEAYPTAVAGPNLYQTVDLPAGNYFVSVYLVNLSAHKIPANRHRDSVVEIAATPTLAAGIKKIGRFPGDIQPAEIFAHSRPIARARCENDFGGVYKRFFLHLAPAGFRYRGLPMGCITVCIKRNHSLNAACEGLFVDPLGRIPRIGYRTVAIGSRRAPGIILRPRQPIPAYLPGEPYIPSETGFPTPAHPFYSIPVVHMPPAGELGGALLQQLLHLRSTNSQWFARRVSSEALFLARYMIGTQPGGRPPVTYLLKAPQQAIMSNRFFAGLLRDVPAQTLADSFYPPMSIYAGGDDELWAWRTHKAARNSDSRRPLPLAQTYSLYHAWWEGRLKNCSN